VAYFKGNPVQDAAKKYTLGFFKARQNR